MSTSKRPENINRAAASIRRIRKRTGQAEPSKGTPLAIPDGIESLADLRSLDDLRTQLVEMAFDISRVRDQSLQSAQLVLTRMDALKNRIDQLAESDAATVGAVVELKKEVSAVTEESRQLCDRVSGIRSQLEIHRADIDVHSAHLEALQADNQRLARAVDEIKARYFSVACYGGLLLLLLVSTVGVIRWLNTPPIQRIEYHSTQ